MCGKQRLSEFRGTVVTCYVQDPSHVSFKIAKTTCMRHCSALPRAYLREVIHVQLHIHIDGSVFDRVISSGVRVCAGWDIRRRTTESLESREYFKCLSL